MNTTNAFQNKIFRIGYARLISMNLIATMVDLQSTIVTDLCGNEQCWIHAHTETINLATDVSGVLIEELKTVSIIADKIKSYRTVNNEDKSWGIISKFKYPNMNLPVS